MQLSKRTKHNFSVRRTIGGQALIEMMIALSILVFGFLGMLSLLSQSLAINKTVADDYTATYLASEGIEIAKNLIDYNANDPNGVGCPLAGGIDGCFNYQPGCYEVDYLTTVTSFSDRTLDPSDTCNQTTLFDSGTTNFLTVDSSGLYGYAAGIITPFKRIVKITIVPHDPVDGTPVEEIQVNSYVTWIGRGGAHNDVNLEDHFVNWRL